MVESPRSAAVLLMLLFMGGVLVWAAVSAWPTVDVSTVLSLRAWRGAERSLAPSPAILGERDALGAHPVEIVEEYPAVRLGQPESVFAP